MPTASDDPVTGIVDQDGRNIALAVDHPIPFLVPPTLNEGDAIIRVTVIRDSGSTRM